MFKIFHIFHNLCHIFIYFIIFSDFAAALGFIPSLLSLLLFEKEIKDILKYDQFFRELLKAGDFENISLKQKTKLINSIKKGRHRL